MKLIIYPIILNFLFTFASVSVIAQGTLVAEERFCSVGGGYCVTLPAGVVFSGAEANFDLESDDSFDEQLREGFAGRFARQWKGEELLVQSEHIEFSDRTGISVDERSKGFAQIVERTKRMILKEIPTAEIKIRESTVAKVSVTDLTVELPKGGFVYRLAVTDGAIVVLRTIYFHALKAQGLRFLDSFETPGVESIIDEKLKAATPEPLPSCDRKASPLSDLEERNLLGSVKSISVEREDTSEENAGRQLRSVQEYDRQGQLRKETSYNGNLRPESVEAHGCLDGKRVYKLGYVSYEDQIIGVAPERSGGKPPDQRYTASILVEFDKTGRLKKMSSIGNDSLLQSTSNYTYGPKTLEVVTDNYDGEVVRREVYTFDANGRVATVVTSTYDEFDGDKTEWRSSFRTEAFDAEGNWIKSSGIEEVFENGKLDERTTFTEYRTITYFK